jgi:lysophospholipase L1-like esterase
MAGIGLSLLAASVLLAAPVPQAGLKVFCFGDSHAQVEAGMGKALTEAFRAPVQYQNFGVIGARAAVLTQSLTEPKAPFSDAVRKAQAWGPDVVILAFGTNEGAAPRLSPTFTGSFQGLIAQTRSAFPNAKVVVLGPPQGKPERLPSLRRVSAAQAQAAAQTQAAWIDRSAFPAEGLQPDGIHFTRAGYQALAKAVAALMPSALNNLAKQAIIDVRAPFGPTLH